MTDLHKPNPSPRRRFQFRLRTLFVVLTVIAVILGTQALMVRPILDLEIVAGRHNIYDDKQWWISTPIALNVSIGRANRDSLG